MVIQGLSARFILVNQSKLSFYDRQKLSQFPKDTNYP
jgi:hypothetical protein